MTGTHSRPKYVEKRNEHTKKNCAPSWFYLQAQMEGCGLDEFGTGQGRVGMAMKIRFPSPLCNFLSRWETVSFWRRTLVYCVP